MFKFLSQRFHANINGKIMFMFLTICLPSFQTPGRLSSSGDNDGLICQEYVVFDIYQACPLYLVEYTIHED